MRFFNSYIGMFITQSVLHSFMTLIIIEMSFYSWEVKDHLTKFRYRLLVLTVPVLMFPVFQAINPERGSMYFRENTAIFDINRWLAIKLWDVMPIYVLFLVPISFTALIFIFQEILPIIMEKFQKAGHRSYLMPDRNIDLIVDKLCMALKTARPSVRVVDESYPVLYTEGVKDHTIILSDTLLDKLNDDQLESALTHEMVHILKGSSLKTQIIYLLRALMFYNPVTLIEFRRLVQDDEFICDSITVAITKKPDALVSSLRTFYSHPKEGKISKISQMKDVIESHSHNLLLNERIAEIQEKGIIYSRGFGWGRFILTIIIILKINYMVV